MKCLVLLSLFTYVCFATSKPCPGCLQLQEGEEAFGAAVFLLQKTLTQLAATEEGPFFTLGKVYSVAVLPRLNYPILTADLIDKENNTERCDVLLHKSLDVEDFTTKFEVEFDCQQPFTRVVNL